MVLRMLEVDALRGRFEGRLVVVEPLAPEHYDGLAAAASGDDIFTWFPSDVAASPATVRAWLDSALIDPHRITFAILDARAGQPVGSTSFLEMRLAHLRVEIGFTWHTPRVWGTGVNVETKLLLLGHAFERVGLRRVEFKTDARNNARAARCSPSAPRSRGPSASTWSCTTARRATPPITRSSTTTGRR